MLSWRRTKNTSLTFPAWAKNGKNSSPGPFVRGNCKLRIKHTKGQSISIIGSLSCCAWFRPRSRGWTKDRVPPCERAPPRWRRSSSSDRSRTPANAHLHYEHLHRKKKLSLSPAAPASCSAGRPSRRGTWRSRRRTDWGRCGGWSSAACDCRPPAASPASRTGRWIHPGRCWSGRALHAHQFKLRLSKCISQIIFF